MKVQNVKEDPSIDYPLTFAINLCDQLLDLELDLIGVLTTQ